MSATVRAAMPASHSLDFDSGFVALDLEHGLGATQLSVKRRWSGSDCLNTHFGPGWSDENLITVTLASPNVALLWRGGVGWLSAQRKAEKSFEGDGGLKIDKTDKGWVAQLPRSGTLTFDTNGRLVSQKPMAGPVRNYTYNKKGRLLTIGTGSGNELRYYYDKRDRVTRVEGPEGLRLEYTYDDKGRLAAAVNAKKIRIEYRYSDNGALLSAKDQFGTELELAKIGPIKRAPLKIAPKVEALATASAYKFDAAGRVKSQTDNATSSSYEYDDTGRVSAITTPEGRGTCQYDLFGRLLQVKNADGTTARFEYNNLDLPTLIAKPDGTIEKLNYDEHGRLLRRERSPSDWEELSYDAAGRIEKRRIAPAAEEHYFYGDNDRVARAKYSTGAEVTYEYDPAGRVLSETWSSGEKRSWRYDTDGRVAESVAPGGLKTTYSYDALGQLIATEDNIHGKTRHRPFRGGAIVENARGKTITSLSEWGKPLAVVEPGGARTIFNYDARGLLERVLSPLNYAWRYEHDGGRRLTAIIAPSGLRITTSRDAQGRRTKLARGSVAWRSYSYDSAGRLEQEYSATGRAARFSYDGDNRATEAELPDGRVAYKYDKTGLRISHKGPGYEVEDEYSSDLKLLRRNYKSARLHVKLPRDASGRAAGVELNDLKASYAYDSRGRLAQINLPGGAAIKVTIDEAARPAEFTFGNGIVEKISYDAADRVIGIESKQSSGKTLFSESYTYNAAGNVSQRVTDGASAQKFEYDRESRLTRISGQERDRTFGYDVDGNLITDGEGTARCQIDELGRPKQRGATSYSWDAGGNLIALQNAKAKIDNVFDNAGRLIERRDGKQTWKAGYLDSHDRLWMESASGKRWYAYLDERLAGFKDETGTAWLIVTLPGTDRPLALCGSNGKTFFVLRDRIGSARRFVDLSGTIVASDDYAPFGGVAKSTGSVPIRMFAGMVRDESGLYYARKRYYDPAIGRFISIDPLIGTPGNPPSHNAYAYASNNPLRYRDPLGAGSFEDEIRNYHETYDYVYKKDPRDPTGNTRLLDENGDPIPETYPEGHPFQGEPIVDKSKPPVAIKNNGYNMLTDAEKVATRQAYDGAAAAKQTIQNPASTAEQVAAASEAMAQHEAELARLNEIMRLRYGHALCLTGTEAGYGGANSDAMMAKYEQRMKELGADPLEHYSSPDTRPVVQERAAAIQAEADAAAAEARRAWVPGKSDTGNFPLNRDANNAGGTGQVTAEGAAGNTATKTSQVTPKSPSAEGAAPAGEKSSAELVASAREKLERGLQNNEAVNISKAEMDAYKAEEAAKAAGKNALVPAGKTAESAGAASEAAGDASRVHDPGILKDGSIRDIDMTKNADGSWTKKPGSQEAPGLEDAEEMFQAGKSARPPAAGDIPMTFDPKTGAWTPAEEAIGERWLGPKILEGAGKLLRPLAPVAKGIMTGAEILQAADLGATMATNFINTLNQPFMEAEKERQGVRWIGERLANDLRQLAAADPEKVITGDAHKFDPNNPADVEDLIQRLGGNLYAGRDPFDGLLTDITKKATSFMGPAEGDTAASFTLENARKLLQTAKGLENEAGEAAKECIREQLEAQSQLQTAMTVAGGRAVAEGGLATVPETANEVKTQTTKLVAQTKVVQVAIDNMKAAGALCDAAAAKVCDIAQLAIGASEEDAKQRRADATAQLFNASNALNAAQATVDNVDLGIEQLRTAVATLEGFRSSLEIYKLGSGLAEGGGLKPDAAFNAAKAAADKASAAREKLDSLLGKLRSTAGQISGLLAPHVAANMEAAALDAAAKTLGSGIASPSLLDIGAMIKLAAPAIEAALGSQRNVERAIGNTDLDRIISAASAALAEAEGVRSTASALATTPERYRSLQKASECLATIGGGAATTAQAMPSPSPEQPEKVIVPDMSAFEGVPQMRAVASQAGLVAKFAAVKPDSKDQEFKFAGQFPRAGEEASKGDVVVVSFYQQFEGETAESSPASSAPPLGPIDSGTMPNLIGLTLDQAVARLPKNMRIGSDEIGDKPPSRDKALTIFSQSPAPNAKIDMNKPIVISVKRYGSARAEVTTAARFDGTYVGSYSGDDHGTVRFTVSGGTITISSPGSGSGRVSASGSASISGAGADGESSYTFSGTFSLSADGQATASGRWSGTQSGFTGKGTWKASR